MNAGRTVLVQAAGRCCVLQAEQWGLLLLLQSQKDQPVFSDGNSKESSPGVSINQFPPQLLASFSF